MSQSLLPQMRMRDSENDNVKRIAEHWFSFMLTTITNHVPLLPISTDRIFGSPILFQDNIAFTFNRTSGNDQ